MATAAPKLGVWAAEGFEATDSGWRIGCLRLGSLEPLARALATGGEGARSVPGRSHSDYADCMAAIRRRFSARHTSFHSAWTRCSPRRLN